MKYIILFTLLVSSVFTSNAQKILPVEKVKEYINSSTGLKADGYTSVQDVNGHFNKFIGIWEGNYLPLNFKYKVKIEKAISSFGIPEDELILRFSIHKIDSPSIEVENNLSLSNNDFAVTTGKYLFQTNTYFFSFAGGTNDCVKGGLMSVSIKEDGKMEIYQSYNSESDQSECDKLIEYFPIKKDVILTKQASITSNFTTALDGWVSFTRVIPISLVGGKLKVTVKSKYTGVSRKVPEIPVQPGDKLKVSITFDKGNTNANTRLFVWELDANGSHISYNPLNYNLVTGTHTYSYTIKKGSKFGLIVNKDSTRENEATNFYIDNITVSKE